MTNMGFFVRLVVGRNRWGPGRGQENGVDNNLVKDNPSGGLRGIKGYAVELEAPEPKAWWSHLINQIQAAGYKKGRRDGQ